MPDYFLSCDWGTSSFRLRLVGEDERVVAEEVSGVGSAEMYKRWTATKKAEAERLFFYQAYLHEQMKKLEAKADVALNNVPVLISGMASSTIGLLELPYKELPFYADGSDLVWRVIEPSEPFSNKLILISGVRTANDVMRGEETLFVGCAITTEQKERVYIFPGTHSKHVYVRSGIAHAFQTYMTGEFFELLSTKSILSNSVEKAPTANNVRNIFFEKGIIDGAATNLLNSAFHVRTAQLFAKHTPNENYHYLSGLLIGTELKELKQNTIRSICLVCGQALEWPYKQGLKVLGLDKDLEFKNADAALVKGQLRIYNAVENRQ